MSKGWIRGSTAAAGHKFVGAALLVFAAALGVCSAAQRPQLERPVMMDSNGPGTELYVLDDAGVLHEFRVQETGLSEYGRAALPPEFAPADMSYLRADSPASLLIAGNRAGQGAVIRLALDGKTVANWRFVNVCSGVDSDSAGETAYVAASDSNEIYRLNPRRGQIVRVAGIPEASKLGPVALDEKRQEVYVADIGNGQVYRYSVPAKKSDLVARVSTPNALVFDSDTDRLFIADPGQGAILVVDMRATKPAAIPFASVRSPYGMTLLSEGRVAVADYSANSILVFSGSGKLLFRFPGAP